MNAGHHSEFSDIHEAVVMEHGIEVDRKVASDEVRRQTVPGSQAIVRREHRSNDARGQEAAEVKGVFDGAGEGQHGSGSRTSGDGTPVDPAGRNSDPEGKAVSVEQEEDAVDAFDEGAGNNLDPIDESFDNRTDADGPMPKNSLPGILADGRDRPGQKQPPGQAGPAPAEPARTGFLSHFRLALRNRERGPWKFRFPFSFGQVVLVLGIALTFAVVGISFLAQRDRAEEPAAGISIPPAPDLDSTPGGEEQRRSEQYQEILSTSNERGAQQAIENQATHIPTPEGFPEKIGDGARADDPGGSNPPGNAAGIGQEGPPETAHWEVLSQAGLENDEFQLIGLTPEDDGFAQGFTESVVDEVVNPMLAHLTALAERPVPRMGQQAFPEAQRAAPVETVFAPLPPPAVPVAGDALSRLGLRPGDMARARMLVGLHSDLPGPAIAEIIEGPLAGARVSGTFAVNHSAGGLALTFNSVSLPDGSQLPVSAIGLSPWTGGSVTRSRLDPRLLERYGGLVLSGAVAGASQAIGRQQSRTTVAGGAVVVDVDSATERQIIGSSVGRAAGAIEADLAGRIPDGALITLDAGAPIVVLFTNSGAQPGSVPVPPGNAAAALAAVAGEQATPVAPLIGNAALGLIVPSQVPTLPAGLSPPAN